MRSLLSNRLSVKARPRDHFSRKATSNDQPSLGALIEPICSIDGQLGGPLSGLTWSCKDLFDVQGVPTSFGNPTWGKTHPVPLSHAPVVDALLKAGASLRGKAHMDELAYSLNGENVHFGTPVNPAAPGRIPGGSSSGSASSTAGGLVDFSLGSDTAGSIRIPASYCGLLGFRPTHGRVSLEGARPLAPRFDTAGLFARDARVLQAAGAVLLAPSRDRWRTAAPPLARFLIASDALALAEDAARDAFAALMRARGAQLSALLPVAEGPVAGGGVGSLEEWLVHFRVLQGREVWQCHGAFVSQHDPAFGPGIRERFEMARAITEAEGAAAEAKAAAVRAHVDALMGGGTVVVLLTAPGPAPVLRCPPPVLEEFRRRALSLTSLAGLNGLPQITIPGLTVGEGEGGRLPVGVSLVGPRGSDEPLLEMAGRVREALFK